MTTQPLTEQQIDDIHWRATRGCHSAGAFLGGSAYAHEVIDQDVPRLIAEIRWLRATLDGDPEQTATPDQQRAWRRSAIRYADKVEAELKALRLDEVALAEIVFGEDTAGKGFREIAAEMRTALDYLDAIIAADMQPGLGPIINACQAAREWRGVNVATESRQ